VKNILFAGMIGVWATTAMAHSPLERTSPADDAIITAVPSEVLFDFKGGIRLTRVTMIHNNHEATKLDLSGHAGFITNHAVPMPDLGHGDYLIEWRGLGLDGHALNGTISFTVE